MTYTIEPMDQNYHRLVKRDAFGHVLYRSKPLRSHELVDLEDALRVHRLGYAKYDPTSTERQDKVPGREWRLLRSSSTLWWADYEDGDCVDDADTWAGGTFKEYKDDEWCWTDVHSDDDVRRYESPWQCFDITGPRCIIASAIPADLTCTA